MRRWTRAAILSATVLVAAVLVAPPPVQRAEAWLRYRLTGDLPPPIIAGQHGRLFLGNHDGSPPGSLIADLCGSRVDAAALDRAATQVRTLVQAGRDTAVPFRFLIVPTAPRIYPEDLPAGTRCDDPAADRLVGSLADPDVIYPVAAMQALKTRFDVLPRRHFHWAGEGPLRVAELVADAMGLRRSVSLTLRDDNRASDLNGFDPGLGLHDRIGTPNLRAAGVAQCDGARCSPPLPASLVAFSRPGPGRILVIGDSFGDEIAGDFSEVAGLVWLLRMNVVLAAPLDRIAGLLRGFRPDAIVVVYHDAGTLALDAASQASLAVAATLLRDADLPASLTGP